MATRPTPEDRERNDRANRLIGYDRFQREADPDRTLPPEERALRAGHLRKAYMLRMALASSKSRPKR